MTTIPQLSAPVWDEAYCVGSEMIDLQHKRLFELLSQLVDAQNGRCDQEVVQHAVNSLYGYIRIHFDDEEQLMENLNFPGREQHHHQHNAFILAFDDLVNKQRQSINFLPELIAFMHKWLVTHVMNEDTQIRNG